MHRILVLLAISALTFTVISCGDDDDQDNDNGPAADVAGTWLGTYASTETDRSGEFCFDVEQDRRDVGGTLIFSGEEPLDIGGRIANQRVSFVWSPQDGATSSDVTRFTTGGTFTGDVDENSIAGTWTSVDGDRGDWSAARPDSAPCLE